MNKKTISQLRRWREALLDDIANMEQRRASHAADEHALAEEIAHSLEVANDVSELLRENDPEHADDYPDPAPAGSAEIVLGLRQMADVLAAHPELTENISKHIQISIYRGTPEEKLKRIEEIADLLGVEPQWSASGNHYHARIEFSGGIQLDPVAIGMRGFAHLARVQPEDEA